MVVIAAITMAIGFAIIVALNAVKTPSIVLIAPASFETLHHFFAISSIFL